MNYRREIDGLRAVAVLPVILFHAGFGFAAGGFVGVDVFFVISGYLITGILIEDHRQGRFSIAGFYERRARRILPALFLVALCCVPFALLWMTPTQLKDFGESLIAVSLFGSNVLFWMESGYFDAAAEEKPLLHTWSLAVEEQYYVLFPLLLLALWRFGRNPVFYAILALALISFSVSEWTSRIHPSANFYLAHTRAWELFAGALCAFARPAGPSLRGNLLSLAGIALILFAVAAFDGTTRFPSAWALAPVVGTVLIVRYGVAGTLTARLLGWRPLVGVGLVSYSAYLWHQPLFAFARIRLENAPPGWLMAALGLLSLALAWASWRFVERPFRARGTARALSRKGIFLFAGAGMAALVGLGLAADLTGGLKQWLTTPEQRAMLATAIPSPKRGPCHTAGVDYRKPAESCAYFAEPARVAVFGDSHAVELAWAVADRLKANGTGVRHLSFGGCAPAAEEAGLVAGCAGWTRDALAFLTDAGEIDTVIVSYRLLYHLFGGHEDDYPALPDTVRAADRDAIWDALKRELATLAAAGKRVVWVRQAPELPERMEKLILGRRDFGEPIAGVDRAWWEARRAWVSERLKELPPAVEVVDPAAFFCNDRTCFASRDGAALYFDDDHMSLAGAGIVADAILKRMPE